MQMYEGNYICFKLPEVVKIFLLTERNNFSIRKETFVIEQQIKPTIEKVQRISRKNPKISPVLKFVVSS